MSEVWTPLLPRYPKEYPVDGKWAKGQSGELVWEDHPIAIPPGVVTPDTAWHYIDSFQNGWAAYDSAMYGQPRYRKTADGMVFLDGLISDGTSQAVAFTLPEGWRISTNGGADYGPHHFHVATAGDGWSYRCLMYHNGDVKPYVSGYGSWVALNGITFFAAE